MPASLVRVRVGRPPQPAGWLLVSPRYTDLLKACGTTTADAVMNLPGEIMCGHPDRHVCRVDMTSGLGPATAYLKREHTRGWQVRVHNLLTGAGWTSRCEREAAVLLALEARGLPGPRVMASGVDGRGFAFLLVAELTGAADIREHLAPGAMSPAGRRRLLVAVGQALGELHKAGVHTPDLAAKHVYYPPGTNEVTLLDWQQASIAGRPLGVADTARALATLDASLHPALASDRHRLRVLRAYLQALGSRSDLGPVARKLRGMSGGRGRRSSVRDQQTGPPVRLVWLAGEAVCATPAAAAAWPVPVDAAPFYSDRPPGTETVSLTDGSSARLIRYRTTAVVGRLIARLRERPWRSPGAEAGRVLAHLARHGIPGPTLLGFGQRFTSAKSADSFVLFALPSAVTFAAERMQFTGVMASCGVMLRRLHDAGLRLNSIGPYFQIDAAGGVSVAMPDAVRRCKRMTPARRKADLRRLFRIGLPGLHDADQAAVTQGYATGRCTDAGH